MKYIAFKRAKTSQSVRGKLPDDYIVEFADTSLFPPGFHDPKEYEIMSEDMFSVELAKNHEHLAGFETNKQAIAESKQESRFQADGAKRAKAKREERIANRPERPKHIKRSPKGSKNDKK